MHPVVLRSILSLRSTTLTRARRCPPHHRNLATSTIPLFSLRDFFGAPATTTDMSHFPKGKSESEWRAQLSPSQFRVLRQKGTERPGTGAYNKFYDEGVYTCAGCHTPLYKSTTKFDSGCGWPAFFDAIPGAIDRHVDRSLGMKRIEITCHNCGGHLGHVFEGEGFPTPTDERHCVNSISLNFTSAESEGLRETAAAAKA